MKDVLSLPSDFIGNETAMHVFFSTLGLHGNYRDLVINSFITKTKLRI
jgi:hypothetical protein